MRTLDSSPQQPFFEEQPTEPIGTGENFGPGVDANSQADLPVPGTPGKGWVQPLDESMLPWEQNDSSAWLNQTAPRQQVSSLTTNGNATMTRSRRGSNGTAPRRKGLRVSRRTLLVGAGIAGLAGVAAAAGVTVVKLTSGQNTSSTPTTLAGNQQIAHLLRRAGFGAAPGEIETYSALGLTSVSPPPSLISAKFRTFCAGGWRA
jgi:hypothetical protein